MLFTEENLKNFKITKNGKFRNILNGNYYYYHYVCIECGYPHLNQRKNAKYCNSKCLGRSSDFRKILSIHMSGNNNWNFGRTGENHPCFGTRRPDASIRMSGSKNPMYGKTGELCPHWKGGISYEPYCTQWTDKEYKNWIVYERDCKCFGSECNGKYIHKLMPHHINYNKKDCRPSNLITLCRSCNAKANYNREWHEAHYTTLMIKRGLK